MSVIPNSDINTDIDLNKHKSEAEMGLRSYSKPNIKKDNNNQDQSVTFGEPMYPKKNLYRESFRKGASAQKSKGILKHKDNQEKYNYNLSYGKNQETPLTNIKSKGSTRYGRTHTKSVDSNGRRGFIKDEINLKNPTNQFLKQFKDKQEPLLLTQFDQHCWKCFGRNLMFIESTNYGRGNKTFG